MDAIDIFNRIYDKVRESEHWRVMASTVEGSHWHREANVAVHTDMTIQHYIETTASKRTYFENVITLVTLLFHDFGKPEAEQTLEKEGQPGVTYHRYAGHEKVSANEFISFICDNSEVREAFFEAGFSWTNIRQIKFMIEHHLPYGLAIPQKRANLAQAIAMNLGEYQQCFYDMLRSDCAGRISDDHETKKAAVEEWIETFRKVTWIPVDPMKRLKGRKAEQPTLYLMVGPSGAGKTTWIKRQLDHVSVYCEDDERIAYAEAHLDDPALAGWADWNAVQRYNAAWSFCHMNKESDFDKLSKLKYKFKLDESFDTGLILDRTNQTRKNRAGWVEAAKVAGYRICAVEFFVSENIIKARQAIRGDKMVPDERVHHMCMNMETTWVGPEVDEYLIALPSVV